MVNLKVITFLSVFLATFAQLSTLSLHDTNPLRCGNEDQNLRVSNRRRNLYQQGYPYKNITYRILDYSKNHTKQDIDIIIQRASNAWSQHTDLKFIQKQPNETADINIRFTVKKHADCPYVFDGRGGKLGHANMHFAHFDDEENWKVKNLETEEGPNLYRTVMHEIGHCLGLGHSNKETAIMFSQHNAKIYELDIDDIANIQEIYGDKKILLDYSEDLCKDPTFDTMFETPDEKSYVFKKDKYYELNPVAIIDGPKLISEKWKDLPDSIGAAFSQNGKTYFFKSGQYWRFTGNEMDQDYPQKLNKWYNEIPDNFNDATVWKDGKVYFFRGSKYWRIDAFNEEQATVTHGLLKEDWKGIPNHTHVVHYSKRFDKALFFKDDHYYFYDTTANAPKPYIIPTTSYFFGCRPRE